MRQNTTYLQQVDALLYVTAAMDMQAEGPQTMQARRILSADKCCGNGDINDLAAGKDILGHWYTLNDV
ncbi:hypothetical protein KXD40_006273 [Peronospora effusa]|uniref:Uncharacterized protein n=1 Tax=Peronospora effusa TaxID=542832 RepID=A0A3M6VV17_9STRA|nr:hypothetical protein DD238_001004 [Peronospora effusa]RQM09787.1 hypothetical protein DD237_006129 [Peronospora effusa]UIZ25745.1 hypothetical protein KXD40_006273 [Peronospora effusa]